MSDESTDTEPNDLAVETCPPSALANAHRLRDKLLAGHNYQVRFRSVSPFPNGPYEGRINIGPGQFIISGTTLDEVLQAMAARIQETGFGIQ